MRRGLFSHGFAAPVTENTDTRAYYEVSVGDGAGHVWVVEIDPSYVATNRTHGDVCSVF